MLFMFVFDFGKTKLRNVSTPYFTNLRNPQLKGVQLQDLNKTGKNFLWL